MAIGVAAGSLTDPETEGRLEGAAGDPNFLAASLVPAIVLAGALIGGVRDALLRGAAVTAILVLAAGLVMSQSRGGALAAVGTLLLALVAFKGKRRHVAGLALLAVGVAVAAFAATPAAWERITTLDPAGSGRSSLWTVAWRVTSDKPLAGVGLDNFVVVAGDYVREPGALTRVERIAEDPQYVHNLYLHVLAESGIVGLALYLAVRRRVPPRRVGRGGPVRGPRGPVDGDAGTCRVRRRRQHADQRLLPLQHGRPADVGPVRPGARAARRRQPGARRRATGRGRPADEAWSWSSATTP